MSKDDKSILVVHKTENLGEAILLYLGVVARLLVGRKWK